MVMAAYAWLMVYTILIITNTMEVYGLPLHTHLRLQASQIRQKSQHPTEPLSYEAYNA